MDFDLAGLGQAADAQIKLRDSLEKQVEFEKQELERCEFAQAFAFAKTMHSQPYPQL